MKEKQSMSLKEIDRALDAAGRAVGLHGPITKNRVQAALFRCHLPPAYRSGAAAEKYHAAWIGRFTPLLQIVASY